MITQSEARDEIFAIFKASWDASSAAVTGYIPKIEYQGAQPRNVPDTAKHWCRISIQTVSEKQASFARNAGEKKFTAFGLVYVQIFSPRSENNGFEKGLFLGKIAKKSFRGKSTPGAVWFYNVRLNELTPEDSFYRLNVVAEYEYDEVG